MNVRSIFITRKISPKAIDKLAGLQIRIWPGDDPPKKENLIHEAARSDGLLCLLTDPIDEEIINAGKGRLKVISQMAVGYDNVDINAATKAGIPVGHTPGVLTETCADFTFGLILAISRRIVESDHQVRKNIWEPWGPDVLIGQEVNGSTLGLVGFGRIGQAVAKRASGFDMKILFYDPTPDENKAAELDAEYTELDDLLKRSDFVSLHTALNAETFHLMDTTRIGVMKKSAYLINTSRGGVVDPEALLWALENKVIRGAAIDVFEPEPIPEDHPLLKLDNIVITPHIASASNTTREKMALMAVENLIAGLENRKMPYCANPQVYADTQQ